MVKTPITRVAKQLARQKRTQQWLATELGVSPSYLSLILSGQRKVSWNMAVRLERVTGINAREFMEAA